MAVIETQDLTKVYGKRDAAVHALRGVDFKVESGEFVAVIGPSGSGKSTLLHLLGGVDRPTGGSIKVENQELSKLSEKQLSLYRRRRIGFVFQYYNLVPVLTVEENIALPLMLDGLKPDQAWLDELLTRLNLTEKRNSLPNQLSGGQQQRTAMARALIHRPALVLADEPTGNLDSHNGREIMALLKDTVRRVGQTLVLITHDANIAAQADRIMIIEDGLIRPMQPVQQA
ncbi:MAG: putative transport system ATP-binding protein [Clostridiales bacterium]|jgi:putative ABC transport system ATP-binding protein|nr:ABC transporter ATP-binding protein [Eubacteriales bacterium]MDD3197053.1 ABC transporter ATP-binding protein [Eubacteriales bacterium]MDD3503389.1 ABC transporter ATP-binding protein [Eubacteriales bacterium]MDD4683255.1 ABC transporter ATP-binding protein [Eubacteriales bacterium]MDN5315875.1 putative transport system ATP-binding protein [Clostridiales bacterium]